MWARVRLDIGMGDLCFAAWRCLRPPPREGIEAELAQRWSDAGDALVCHSVRSGFDLLLSTLALPPGSEVLFSALNVKGMVRIARSHGLIPVPVDLDFAHMAPRLDALERALSPASRVLVVAHLFGTRAEIAPVIELARARGILVVEDAAQAFSGLEYTGHPDADVAMFSFGPLKTATALGGALVRVRSAALLEGMRKHQASWPVHGRGVYAGRVLKFAAIKLVTARAILAALARAARAGGWDYEDALSDTLRGVASLGSEQQLRFRPSAPMLALLLRRISRFDARRFAARRAAGRALLSLLGDAVACPAAASPEHGFWVFPIQAAEPRRVIEVLRRAGFDAAVLGRSQAVEAPADRPHLDPLVARTALAQLVILPCHPEMPAAELAREAALVRGLCSAASE